MNDRFVEAQTKKLEACWKKKKKKMDWFSHPNLWNSFFVPLSEALLTCRDMPKWLFLLTFCQLKILDKWKLSDCSWGQYLKMWPHKKQKILLVKCHRRNQQKKEDLFTAAKIFGPGVQAFIPFKSHIKLFYAVNKHHKCRWHTQSVFALCKENDEKDHKGESWLSQEEIWQVDDQSLKAKMSWHKTWTKIICQTQVLRMVLLNRGEIEFHKAIKTLLTSEWLFINRVKSCKMSVGGPVL